MTVPRARLVLAALSGLLLAACGGADENGAQEQPSEQSSATTAATGESRPAAGADAITVSGFLFKPATLQVKAGSGITWTNQDQILHTVTSGKPPAADGTFNSKLDGVGSTFVFTLERPGSYKYFCSQHNSMTGEVVVS